MIVVVVVFCFVFGFVVILAPLEDLFSFPLCHVMGLLIKALSVVSFLPPIPFEST